ncbi:MAG: CopG family transcriptional regulator [Actinomycetales bacterium]
MTRRYRVGPYVDLDKDPVTLPSGRVIDEAAAQTMADETLHELRRGRPSLHGKPGASPEVRFRLEPGVKQELDYLARQRGVTPSQVMRDALRAYLQEHAS